MKQKSRVLAAAFVVPVLVLSSVSAFALGFGRPTSHAVLGEPLTLTVPIRIEASEELTDECVGAEVHFGDVRVSDSAVNLSLQGRSATERILRVTTLQPRGPGSLHAALQARGVRWRERYVKNARIEPGDRLVIFLGLLQLFQLVQLSGQAGQIGRTKRGGFNDLWPFDHSA